MIKTIENFYALNTWTGLVDILHRIDELSVEGQNRFHSMWIERGGFIREQICNDLLLAEILWKLLPPYNGEDKKLYRGENITRLKNKSIGFCWTNSIETAILFAQGHNSVDNGGVVISCNIKANWIISGISDHSKYLEENEYTIDPIRVNKYKIIKRYPAILFS